MKTLYGHMPKVVSTLTPKGRLAATRQLHLAIGLPLRDPAGLDAFLADLYNPASPNFRHYLTPQQVTDRFGPTTNDYAAVKNFARTNGLTVTTEYSNRLLLDVTGPVSAIEKTFHALLLTYRHPSEARDFFAPDTEPTVDARLPIIDVQGLSDYARPQPRFHSRNTVKPGIHSLNGTAPDSSGLYFGNDFRNAYVPDSSLTGAGQSLGLFEADGYYTNDIINYATAAGNGRTNIAIQLIKLDGFSGTPTTGANSGNAEVSLDIEMAMAIAPGLTKIVVYEGNPASGSFIPNDILNAMLADSNAVKNLSSSWGWSGGPSTTTDTIFKNMAAVGQTYFNAVGDSDAFTTGGSSANGVDNPSLTDTPSSSPYITQVGGTTLSMSGGGAGYASEKVWNWNFDSAASAYVGTSGGISSFYAEPYWQTNVNVTSAGGSTSFRNTPDVALTADEIYVTYGNGGHHELGGTSCAAPLWAGFIALANQQTAALSEPPVGFINPAIYSIAAGPNYAVCFHDVTTGSNAWPTSPSQFFAAPGYDLCTGLGSPMGQNLINALVGSDSLAINPRTGAGSGFAGAPLIISSGSFQLTNSGSASLDWTLFNPVSWLSFSLTNGTLAAGATTTVFCGLIGGNNNLAAGTYVAPLAFSNGTSHVVQICPFTLQVIQPLLVSPTNGFTATGSQGGPFNVTSQNFVLTNQSYNSLSWSIANSPAWLSVSPASGTLAGNSQTNVTVSLSATANTLSPGAYSVALLVTNFAGPVASLPFTLSALDTNQPIVVNGGFETGDLTGWTLNASASRNFVTPSVGWFHTGTYGLAMNQRHSLGFLSQSLKTIPGQAYLLSLWLANPSNANGATPNQFVVQWNGNTLYNQVNLPFMAWTNLQFIVTAASTSTLLQFGFEDTPYYLALDDISVVRFSPPGFAAVRQIPTGFNFTWNAITGQKYQVQYTTNLAPPNWINLGGQLTSSTGTLNLQDTNATPDSSPRFYRLVEGP